MNKIRSVIDDDGFCRATTFKNEIQKAYHQERADAIDEFVRLLRDEYHDDGYKTYYYDEDILRVAEQLKEQK